MGTERACLANNVYQIYDPSHLKQRLHENDFTSAQFHDFKTASK